MSLCRQLLAFSYNTPLSFAIKTLQKTLKSKYRLALHAGRIWKPCSRSRWYPGLCKSMRHWYIDIYESLSSGVSTSPKILLYLLHMTLNVELSRDSRCHQVLHVGAIYLLNLLLIFLTPSRPFCGTLTVKRTGGQNILNIPTTIA